VSEFEEDSTKDGRQKKADCKFNLSYYCWLLHCSLSTTERLK